MIDAPTLPPAYVQPYSPFAPRKIESDKFYWIRTVQSGDHWFLARRTQGRWWLDKADQPLLDLVLEVGPRMF